MSPADAPAGGPPVHLLRGSDAVLLGDELRRVVDEVVGDGDRSLMVEELGDDRYVVGDDHLVNAVVDAAQTPPFLTARRVVVARHLARFGTVAAVAPLVAYLESPLDTTSLILVWDKGPSFQGAAKAPPRALVDAVKRAGGVSIGTDVPANLASRDAWLKEHLGAAPVRLDARARSMIVDHLGEDVHRLGALLDVLESTYGAGTRIGADEVEPFLGEAGGVPPWELTDAIDAGDLAGAIDKLHRMLAGGDRHPLQVMASLHGHVAGLVALDGAEARSKAEAAAHLGITSEFRAGKLLAQSRRVAGERSREMLELLAEADLDLRGAKEWPGELVLELLVARLARLSAAR